jgi:hypothetical protein
MPPDHSGLFYGPSPPTSVDLCRLLQGGYVDLAALVWRTCPANGWREEAGRYLEESFMRALWAVRLGERRG